MTVEWRTVVCWLFISGIPALLELQDLAEPYSAGLPVLLWWTPFTGDPGTVHQCGSRFCYLTQNRSYLQHDSLGSVLFYGSDFAAWDLPLPRSDRHIWALVHEESPKNAPIFCHREAIELFNMTATFREASNLPLTLLYLESADWLTSLEFVVSVEEKFALTPRQQSALVYLASSCECPAERDQFVAELGRHIGIDSYGACLNNRSLPDAVQRGSSGDDDSSQLLHFLSTYQFYLALENARCPDYITEKLWRPLRIGVVPVYFGAPNVRRWLPCPKAAVLAEDFSSPQELAKYLIYLTGNASAYAEHLCHKRWGVHNKHLSDALANRMWGMGQHVKHMPNFVEAFECSVCEAVWSDMETKSRGEGRRSRQADMTHYGCPRPRAMLSTTDADTWWTEQWDRGAVQASVLRRLVADNESVDRALFHRHVFTAINGKDEL